MCCGGEVDDERRDKNGGEEAEAGGWGGFCPLKYSTLTTLHLTHPPSTIEQRASEPSPGLTVSHLLRPTVVRGPS